MHIGKCWKKIKPPSVEKLFVKKNIGWWMMQTFIRNYSLMAYLKGSDKTNPNGVKSLKA